MFVPTPANNFLNAYANNETVTQGIADYCEANGHGTWTKDGQDTHQCPRCGYYKLATIAQVSANNLVCSCGSRHSIMSGQELLGCPCGSTYKIPELGYNETAFVNPMTELALRLHNQAIWEAMGKVSPLTKLNDAHIRELTI